MSDYFREYKKANIDTVRKRWSIDSALRLEKLKTDKNYAEKIKIKNSDYTRNRRRNDKIFKMKDNLSGLLRSALKNKRIKPNTESFRVIGCDYETLKNHIESQFKPGMTWENKGQWQIDHIFPLSKAIDEQHLIELCHYTNIRPLWSSENQSKFTNGDDRIVRREKREKVYHNGIIEQWDIIPEFSMYEISNFGRVKSINKNKFVKLRNRGGVLSFSAKRDDGVKTTVNVSRYVVKLFLNHDGAYDYIDGDSTNNKIDNLRILK